MDAFPFPRTLIWVVVLILVPAVHAGIAGQPIEVVIEIWPPFRIGDAQTPESIRGIDIDVLNLLTERLGVTYRIQRLPWARCLIFMETGEADLISGLAHTPERARYIRYSVIPYHTVSPAFYVRTGNAGRIRGYADLAPLTIAYSLKSAYFEPFDSDGELYKIGVSTEKQLLLMLAAGHVDTIIGTDANVAYDMAAMGLGDEIEQAVYRPDHHTDLYLGISRGSPLMERAGEIDRILKEIVQGGEMDAILGNYFK